MESFIFGAMAVVLLLFSALLLAGSRALVRRKAEIVTTESARWPPVALMVPVTGAAANLRDNLRSLLTQDYPDYQVIFSTKDLADPATPVIAALIPEYPRACLLVSGPAVSCGQKNHNLLAGVRAAGESTEIFAFCDATRQAPPNWLKGLVLPIAQGREVVVSGYHHVLPQDQGLAVWGRAVTVLFLYLTKGISRLNQTWGGATAISRRVFQDLEVARLWSHNVVDDVSLAALLQAKGLRVGLALGDSLITPIAHDTLASWRDWLIRQWIYLKFCLPGAWVALGLVFYLLAGLVLFSGLNLVAALLGVSWLPLWPGVLFLAGLAGLAVFLKTLHPQPPSLGLWLPAFFAAIFMGAWCHLLNWGEREIHWRGISYRVGWKGRVVGIKKSSQ
ncbi:MAG: glycosyltransferase [Thermodesulfobacteriota bacterium]